MKPGSTIIPSDSGPETKFRQPVRKSRLDLLLVDRQLASSRDKARQLILSGSVYVDGQKVEKAGTLIGDSRIEVRERENPYVSRGGLKLAHALRAFGLRPEQKVILDAGASTGGFTDCLLQNGAARVYAVDVGYGQLAWKLFNHPAVIRIERTNVRYLDPKAVPERVDWVVADLSFISVTLVLGHLLNFMKEEGEIVILIKPQFEVGREEVGRGGIVRQEALRQAAIEKVEACGAALGLLKGGLTESPITGQKGNREYLIHFLRRTGK